MQLANSKIALAATEGNSFEGSLNLSGCYTIAWVCCMFFTSLYNNNNNNVAKLQTNYLKFLRSQIFYPVELQGQNFTNILFFY